MQDWRFPFKTCERPKRDAIIAQPYSFLINLIGVFILGIYAFFSRRTSVRVAILSYMIFEVFHAFSHAYRFDPKCQTAIIHFLAYLFFFTSWWVLRDRSGRGLKFIFNILLFLLILGDLFVYLKFGGLWPVITGFGLLISLFTLYYPYLPRRFQYRLTRILIPGVFLLILLFVNEAYNCDKMMEALDMPYHAIIEILGIFLFVVLADSFYRW